MLLLGVGGVIIYKLLIVFYELYWCGVNWYSLTAVWLELD